MVIEIICAVSNVPVPVAGLEWEWEWTEGADVSNTHSSWTPGVFYTCFYNHARRLRLEKLL